MINEPNGLPAWVLFIVEGKVVPVWVNIYGGTMEEVYITSRTNPLVISLSRLADKKERDKTGLYIAEGFKLCREACGRGRVQYAVLRQDRRQQAQYIDIIKCSGGAPIVLSEAAYDKITKDRSPDGILFVMEMAPMEIPRDMTGERICILDGIQDPGNVGTIIRTAAALKIDRVILHDCADVYNPKVIRATMGALFRMPVSICTDLLGLIARLQNAGRRVLATALSKQELILGDAPLHPTDCPILGNEGHGIAETVADQCDASIKIPMTDKTESLNAAAAAAVLLWEYSKL